MLSRELVDNKSLIADLWETERLIIMNKRAEYHYYQERGYRDLIGKSIFACHQNPKSEERIKSVVKRLKNHADEVFLKVNQRNERFLYCAGKR